MIINYFPLYGIEIGDKFRLGVLLSFLSQGVFTVLTIWTQPHSRWKGYTRWQKIQFWGVQYLFAVTLGISNMFNWFYSGAIQVWLLSGIFLIILLVILYKRSSNNKWWKNVYFDF